MVGNCPSLLLEDIKDWSLMFDRPRQTYEVRLFILSRLRGRSAHLFPLFTAYVHGGHWTFLQLSSSALLFIGKWNMNILWISLTNQSRSQASTSLHKLVITTKRFLKEFFNIIVGFFLLSCMQEAKIWYRFPLCRNTILRLSAEKFCRIMLLF